MCSQGLDESKLWNTNGKSDQENPIKRPKTAHYRNHSAVHYPSPLSQSTHLEDMLLSEYDVYNGHGVADEAEQEESDDDELARALAMEFEHDSD